MPKDPTRHSFFTSITLLAFAFLVAGCSAKPEAAAIPARPSATRPAPTATPQAETATPAITSTPAPTTPPFTRCQEIIGAQWPKDFLTEGSIIFTGECEGKEGLYKLSAATRRIEPLMTSKYHYYGGSIISPDHQWLAIENPSYISSTLDIMGDDGSSKIRYAIDRNWTSADQWLDSGLIAMGTKDPWSKILLNPSTGSISRFSAHWDGYLSWPEEVVFDPSLKYVVFLPNSMNYNLMEVAPRRILWQSDPKEGSAWSPQWSPDGAYFVISIWANDSATLKIVSRDGQQVYTSKPFTPPEAATVVTQWSSNGKYLTYWEKTKDGKHRLGLLDVRTHQTTYGNETITFDKQAQSFPDFLQNDQKLIFQSYAEQENAEVDYLVDLASGKTARIDINLTMLAWIKTKQAISQPPSEPFPLPPRSGAGVKQTCLKLQENASKLSWDGALVFSNDSHLYTLSPAGKITLLANNEEAYISPNRKWLTFVTSDDNLDPRLWLTSLDATPTEITRMGGYTAPFVTNGVHAWFSDDEVWMGDPEIGYYKLFNPFTKQLRGLIPFQENDSVISCIDHACPALDDYIYDQALERHAFLSGGFPGGRLVLQSRNGNVLWSHEDSFAGLDMPEWQPGDKLLGVPMVNKNDVLDEHYEFFTVDRDGHQRQLTNYTAAYPTMSIDKFSWSPNGRYIAFWGDTHSRESIAPQNPYRLFVLDTLTRQTVDYCVAGDYSNNRAPIWSPDGKQIAINGLLDGKRHILLLDFAAGTVTPVAEGELIGWLAEK